MSATSRNAPVHAPRARTVVIFEPDALMRDLLAEWLAGDGYAVWAWDGTSPGPAVDAALVIVDVVRPRHDGAARMRAVRAAFPRIPVIAISGHFQPGLCGAGRIASELGVRQVIAKPFNRTQLLAAVHEVAA